MCQLPFLFVLINSKLGKMDICDHADPQKSALKLGQIPGFFICHFGRY
jgi:hypothetical protein